MSELLFVNTMRFSVHHVIKLLTLVHDSSMEQKPELFPSTKIQTKTETQNFYLIFRAFNINAIIKAYECK